LKKKSTLAEACFSNLGNPEQGFYAVSNQIDVPYANSNIRCRLSDKRRTETLSDSSLAGLRMEPEL
jgi:hypothetical protein